jgi:hypothetical protein
MERGHISVTPLSVDLTDLPALERLKRENPLAEPPPGERPAEPVDEDE